MRLRARFFLLVLLGVFAGSASAANNPVPHIDSPLVPTSTAPGGPAFTLTVNGTGFVSGSSGSVVNWNGSARTTTFVSAGKLTAAIPSSDVATAGAATITVKNPAPGGGTSNVMFFEISGSVGNPQFTPILQSTQGMSVGPLVTGDFNGDGKLDVAYLNPPTQLIVQLGNGDGTFQAPLSASLSISAPAYRLAAADFNGDGKLDLALLTGATSSLSYILLGNGDGTFQPAQQGPVGSVDSTLDLFVADFNGDGNVDLLMGGAFSSLHGGPPLVLFLGNGDGTFQAGNIISTNAVGALAVGDFNGDGILDVVAGLSIFLGKGDGTFQAPKAIPRGDPNDTVQTMIAADVNGDGKLDLVLGLGFGGVGIMLGNGDGTFQTPVNYPIGPNSGCGCDVLGLAAADFNGDGKLDLLVGLNSNNPGSPLWILLGNGDGTFQPPVTYSGQGFGTESSAVGDFNSDGKMDFVAAGIVPGGNGGDNLRFYLQGQLPVASPAPTALDFGSQSVGTRSTPQAVTLTNSGLALLTISNISVGGADPGDFVLNNGCDASLAPSASCQISITFAPASPGALTAALTIHDNAPGGSQTIGLTGGGNAPVVTLSPATLTFSSQPVGTSGLPQTVTLTNTGNVQLNIASVKTTADFGQLSACGSSLAVGASCSIGVFFDPSTGGARTGTLTVTDDAGNSPQTVSLTGTGQDFSVGASGAASATITAGQTASYTLTFAPMGGLNQTIALSCSGAPAMSTCSVSPSMVSLSGTAAATAMVTVTTTAHGSALPFGLGGPLSMKDRPAPLIVVPLGTLVLLVVSLLLWRREQRFRWAPLFALAALVSLGMTLTSCGGGSSSGGSGGSTGTQAGTYSITVSGSFTSGSTTLTHATKLTLVVQ